MRENLGPRTIDRFCNVAGHLFQLASDDVNSLFRNLMGWQPFVKELDIQCHADEASAVTSQQNVKFVDEKPSPMDDRSGTIDQIRKVPMIQDATLNDFFSRPILIKSIQIPVGGTLKEYFDPWVLYFTNPRVKERLESYKLAHAKLHLKAVINGNAFHYGRFLISYNPLHDVDNITERRVTLVDADNVAASQRPHFFVNPTTSIAGEMVLPYFFYQNNWSTVTADFAKMGEIHVSTLQALKHANGASDIITLSFFAWAEDMSFAVPTQAEIVTGPALLEVTPQADEYGNGPLSRPAGIVANIAEKLVTAPLIGPFALATQIGASAISSIATLFGYSRPADTEHKQYRPNAKSSLAVSNMPDDVQKLSLDFKQEVSIDPRITGLDSQDEMDINYIASRESYLTQFPWALADQPDKLLWNIVVDPGVHRVNNNELHFPATAFVSMPFKYWRGTMIYRFQIVCSGYHRGRLRIVYDPETTFSSSTEYNIPYSTIVDITETTDFEIKVGWGQTTTYRETIKPLQLEESMFGTDDLSIAGGYLASIDAIGNGTLSVYILNELTVPNSTIDNDININVFISAGNDFELAAPTSQVVPRLRLEENPVTAATTLSETRRQQYYDHFKGEKRLDVEPQADPGGNPLLDNSTDVPVHPASVDQLASTQSLVDPTNHVHFGESIRSLRQLVKRYCLHEYLRVFWPVGTSTAINKYQRSMMPFEPGYTAATTSNLPLLVGGNSYLAGFLTIQRYVSLGYGGWRGSMRYLIDCYDCDCLFKMSPLASRSIRCQPDNIIYNVGTGSDYGAAKQRIIAFDDMSGIDGNVIQVPCVNGLINFEVPYYTQYRFNPGKVKADLSLGGDIPQQPCWRLAVAVRDITEDKTLAVHVAAGEDFNCFMFLGAPIFYYEGTPP